MPDTPARILIVDDAPSIRRSMSIALTERGYHVRSAIEGFSALRAIREEMPDILLADLNMPGMSGFELLTIVWRRFPAVQKIAMSGAYSGNAVPSGVAADAFFQKGSSMLELLRIIDALPQRGHRAAEPASASAPLRIDRNGHGSSSAAQLTMECPECLRAFSQPIGGTNGFMHETYCIHCGSSIQYAIVDPQGPIRFRPPKRATSATLRAEQN
jgi:DNA-binding NtrC family response regulator